MKALRFYFCEATCKFKYSKTEEKRQERYIRLLLCSIRDGTLPHLEQKKHEHRGIETDACCGGYLLCLHLFDYSQVLQPVCHVAFGCARTEAAPVSQLPPPVISESSLPLSPDPELDEVQKGATFLPLKSFAAIYPNCRTDVDSSNPVFLKINEKAALKYYLYFTFRKHSFLPNK